MARHYAEDGFWTFDGTSPATGFHLLYGYFLFFVYSITGSLEWRSLYLLIGLLSSFSIGLSAFLICRTVQSVFGYKVVPVALSPFLTASAMMLSTAMMESWLVLFFSALTVFSLTKEQEPSFYGSIGLIAIGFLGSLARTDYGMLPGVIFCTIIISRNFQKNAILNRSFLILAGAIIGISVVLLQNYFISGHFFQASAQTKLYWSSVGGHSMLAPVDLILSIVFPFLGSLGKSLKILLFIAFLLALIYPLKLAFGSKERNNSNTEFILFCGCVLTILGYIIFYRHNSLSLQNWYSSNLIVPIAIVFAAVCFYVLRGKAFIAAIFLFGAYFLIGSSSLLTIPWPHQAGMMHAGIFLKNNNAYSNVAAWNAGIISYFSGKPVINIDGLTNDEVLPFIKSNTLLDYVKKRNIKYLVDYEAMVKIKLFRTKGGYDDARTDKCIKPLQAVDGDFVGWANSRLMLFEIVPECL